MTEQELKVILARNPLVTAVGYDHQAVRQISAAEQEQRAPDASDAVVDRKAKSQGSITVRFTICCIKLSDVDAIHGRGKDLLDGLADAGLIPGDRQNQISYEAVERKVAKRKNQGVRIEIEYA